MKKTNDSEYFNSPEINEFFEYKRFDKEKYSPLEMSKSPLELEKRSESFNESNQNEDHDTYKKELSLDQKSLNYQSQKQLIQQNMPTGNVITKALSTLTSAAVVTVASVAVLTTSPTYYIEEYIETNPGMDYVAVTVDLDGILEANKDVISIGDYYIEIPINEENKKIEIEEGKNTYLITGLIPNETYTYNFIGNEENGTNETTYYQDTITTSSEGEATAIYDERNSLFLFNEETHKANYEYSIYLSDYYNQYPNAVLYACSEKQTNLSRFSNILHFNDTFNNDRFYQGQIENINSEYLYLYIVSQSENYARSELNVLFEKEIKIDYPGNWDDLPFDIYRIKKDLETHELLPDTITISGTLDLLDNTYQYYAHIKQMDSEGNVLREEEANYTIDNGLMKYTIIADAYYGVSKYQYIIYYENEISELEEVYRSEEFSYTISQEFSGTYQAKNPRDAVINYYDDYITITVNPEFVSNYNNYYYVLTVTNSDGSLLGEYSGVEEAVIRIDAYQTLDIINFGYKIYGSFVNGEIEFVSLNKEGKIPLDIYRIKKDLETHELLPDTITISGTLDLLDNTYQYYAHIKQMDSEGNVLREEEANYTIDNGLMKYTIIADAYYGVSKYQYIIYYENEISELEEVYRSEEFSYTISQEFSGTYQAKNPRDAVINYYDDYITITVNPEFVSNYNNYYYVLTVTNSDGSLLGEYSGVEEAVIRIDAYQTLDIINFGYKIYGSFVNGEIEFVSLNKEGKLNYPKFSLLPEVNFNGENYEINYTCDMIFDYSTAILNLVVTANSNVYNKQITPVNSSGTIVLDMLTGEIGEISVSGSLTFTDNQLIPQVQEMKITGEIYTIEHVFNAKLTADLSYFATSEGMIPVYLEFSYYLPSNYSIQITETTSAFATTVPLTSNYSFTTINTSDEGNVIIQVLDESGNPYLNSQTFVVSKSLAESNYVSPTVTSLNPGDSVVTYNEDGTINIYRDLSFETSDPNIYYNARLGWNGTNEDGEFVSYYYDLIGRNRYAIIENIPARNYFFVYDYMYDYNGVSYIMYEEMPSGSAGFSVEEYSVETNVADGQTNIKINICNQGMLVNKIVVNGIEYEYTSYTGITDTYPTLVIEGEIEITSIIIYHGGYYYNYEFYQNDITMKGATYREVVIV